MMLQKDSIETLFYFIAIFINSLLVIFPGGGSYFITPPDTLISPTLCASMQTSIFQLVAAINTQKKTWMGEGGFLLPGYIRSRK